MKKYVIKNKQGSIIQTIKTDGQITAHPAWGKPERIVLASSEYNQSDVIENSVIGGISHVKLKADYTIEESDSCAEELFDLYQKVRADVLSEKYDIFRISPGMSGNYLDLNINNQNATNADILRSCRGTNSPYYIKDASFFVDWDLGPQKNRFPDWVKPIIIAYRKYDDDYQQVTSKYAKVDKVKNTVVNDDKQIDLWVEFKALWVSYADKLQSMRALQGGKGGTPQSY